MPTKSLGYVMVCTDCGAVADFTRAAREDEAQGKFLSLARSNGWRLQYRGEDEDQFGNRDPNGWSGDVELCQACGDKHDAKRKRQAEARANSR